MHIDTAPTAPEAVVRSFRIIGTDSVVFQAWEPTGFTHPRGHAHSSITSDDQGGSLGMLQSRRLSDEFEAAFPLDWFNRETIEARSAACSARSAALYALAYDIIEAQVPGVASVDQRRNSGEITVNYHDVAHIVDERGRVTAAAL